jgi:hypothetical protein
MKIRSHAEVIATEVLAERGRQDAKWGEQDHPDGTCIEQSPIAEAAKRMTDEAARLGRVSWSNILVEEVWEALTEVDPQLLRTELIQVAAVAQQWIEAIDRRDEGEQR